jgi:predicted MPP superfamily phosphohydrolase
MLETSYIRGDFWFNNMLMIVSRGLGMSLAPVRYNSTPEITLINLAKK